VCNGTHANEGALKRVSVSRRLLWFQGDELPPGLSFLLAKIGDDRINVVVELRSMLLPYFSHFLDDRISPHDHSPYAARFPR